MLAQSCYGILLGYQLKNNVPDITCNTSFMPSCLHVIHILGIMKISAQHIPYPFPRLLSTTQLTRVAPRILSSIPTPRPFI